MTKNIVQGEKYRFTVLTDKLLRMEYSEKGQFEDQRTQVVQNRSFETPDFEVLRNHGGHQLEIITEGFHLYYEGGQFNNDTLFIDAKYNFETYYSRWYFGEKIEKNLKGTARTLDKADGAIPLEDGLMTKGGFSILDDSQSLIQEGTTVTKRAFQEVDVYYFAYGRDYLATLRAYYQLSGYTPLVPRYALGNWWSRFYPYMQSEYLDLMHRFDEEKIPIAVSVFDMNWHTTDIPAEEGSGWTGYTWNKKLFPEPNKIMDQMHEEGRKVTLNVHPAAGIRSSEESYPQVADAMGLNKVQKEPAIFDLQNPTFVNAYFNIVHRNLEEQGVDFWWIDWQQGGTRGQHLDPLWLLNILHYQDNAEQHDGNGLILSRYAGPGSHRYPIGFSGDTVASWQSLQFQPYFTATASNIGYTWWSHDIGGHMHGRYNAELSLRWLQFGVFSPIMRLHSSDNLFMGKEPWNYDLITQRAMVKFLQLRSKLVPYIDSANERTHSEGIPLIQPLYYKHPTDKKAYQYPNEYYFGDQMLVAPITQPKNEATGKASVKVWLPAGVWTDFFTGVRYKGNQVLNVYRDANTYPVFVKEGSIIPLNPDFMQPIEKLPAKLEVQIFPGKDVTYDLYEHVGRQIAHTIFKWDETQKEITVKVEDPESILPQNRAYVYKLANENDVLSQELRTKLNYQPTNQDDLLRAKVRECIQYCELDFDQKMEIWRMFTDSKLSQGEFNNYLNTLGNTELAGLIGEYAGMVNRS